MPSYRSPVPLLKFQMAPRLRHYNILWVQEKQLRYASLSAAKALYSTKLGLRFLPLLHTSYRRGY
jgi:hypothetical protein